MWYLTLHRWVGDRQEAVKNALHDHLAWMREQQLAGKVLMAGPTPDFELGIIVFGHMPESALHQLCRTEPFVAAGYRNYETIPWDVHHLLGIGSFDLKTLAATTRPDDCQS
jgi:uncharacterized protein YciI